MKHEMESTITFSPLKLYWNSKLPSSRSLRLLSLSLAIYYMYIFIRSQKSLQLKPRSILLRRFHSRKRRSSTEFWGISFSESSFCFLRTNRYDYSQVISLFSLRFFFFFGFISMSCVQCNSILFCFERPVFNVVLCKQFVRKWRDF